MVSWCPCYKPDGTEVRKDTVFVRVDSDTIDNLIRKDDVNKVTLNEDEKNALQEMFKSQLPKIEKTDFIVTFEALGENSNPGHADTKRIYAPYA